MLRDLFSLFPAYAGVIPLTYDNEHVPWSFPRIRGGDPVHLTLRHQKKQLFPAYAGVILCAPTAQQNMATFPRIRGGDPSTHDYRTREMHFSPHTRG